MAFCFLKRYVSIKVIISIYFFSNYLNYCRNNAKEAIKNCLEAIKLDPKSVKAFYRLSKAQVIANDYEGAKKSLVEAIKLDPGSKSLREEYDVLTDAKDAKEKEWYAKMSGFYNSSKLDQIEQKDEEQKLLKEKLYKQTYGQ